MPQVLLEFSSNYSLGEGPFPILSTFTSQYSLGRVEVHHVGVYAFVGMLKAEFQGAHSLTTLVSKVVGAAHDIKTTDPIKTEHSGGYAIIDAAEVEIVPPILATVDARSLELVSFSLTSNLDSYCLDFSGVVPTVEDWLLCEPGAALTVSVDGEDIALVIDGRTRSRSYPGAEYQFSARSPASRLAAPHVTPMTKNWIRSTAKTIAAELAQEHGFALDWRIVDYPLELYSVENATPPDVLSELATGAGVLLSDLQGGLVVEYRYPLSPTRYDGASTALTLSDTYDVIELSEEREAMPGYTAVSVMSEAAASNPEVTLQDWQGVGENTETPASGTKIVAVFTHPFLPVELQSNDCGATIVSEGVYTFDVSERVEFVEGRGALTYYPQGAPEYVYECGDLGELVFDGKNAVAEISGQSLATMNYTGKYQRFIVSAPEGAAVQCFVEVDPEDLKDSTGGRIVHVKRESPPNGVHVEAPELLVDELCVTDAIARERGRCYLDEYGFDKERYEASTLFRGLPLPGNLAAVHDASLGAAFKARITGWSVNAAYGEVSMRWDLERSIIKKSDGDAA